MRSVLASQAKLEHERAEAAHHALRLEFRNSASLDEELARTTAELAALQPPGAATLLPPGWIEQIDLQPGSATHGRAFYVDTATGHTQWERPHPPHTLPPPPPPPPPSEPPSVAGAGAASSVPAGQQLVTVPPGMSGGMRVPVQHQADGQFDWFLVPEGLVAGNQFAAFPIGSEPQPQQAQQQPASAYGPQPAASGYGGGGGGADSDALMAAGFGAEEAVARGGADLDAGRYDQAIAMIEEALTAFQNTNAAQEMLMARGDVQQLIAMLTQAEDAKAALAASSPVAVAEAEAEAAGFTAEQIAMVQGLQPSGQALADPSDLISALLEVAVPSPRPAAATAAPMPLGFRVSGSAPIPGVSGAPPAINPAASGMSSHTPPFSLPLFGHVSVACFWLIFCSNLWRGGRWRQWFVGHAGGAARGLPAEKPPQRPAVRQLLHQVFGVKTHGRNARFAPG